MTAKCQACGQWIVRPRSMRLTARELDVLSAWWHTGSVKKAAALLGMGEQNAKNKLAHARNRADVPTNDDLMLLHIEQLRSKSDLVALHNSDREEVA